MNSKSFAACCALAALLTLCASVGRGAEQWLTFPGGDGPGRGLRVVLMAGDEEYRSEEGLPQLAKILSRRHGFSCTVLFSIDPKTGFVDPNCLTNTPGLEALDSADLLIIQTRYRHLPDEQMRHIVNYLNAGKPVIGLRTATHAFDIPPGETFSRYGVHSRIPGWVDGFGRRIFGETWVSHHGSHGHESTRAVLAPGVEGDPLVRGVGTIWCSTDVYTVRLPLPGDSRPLLLGQVLSGMNPADPPVAGPKNHPLMPVAWTHTYTAESGRTGRAFVTTMGAATDLLDENLRRLIVNAAYWCIGRENRIPPRADVDLVGDYHPTPFGFNGFQRDRTPANFGK